VGGEKLSARYKRNARVLEIARPSACAVPPSLRWTKLVNAGMVVIRVGKGCTVTFDDEVPHGPVPRHRCAVAD